ncbi:AI-2E family transporter [Candidatus Dojkabacteria bacterium]|nr:AI-2E family transporter [Candidatus Dojkabacteria bacterium]
MAKKINAKMKKNRVEVKEVVNGKPTAKRRSADSKLSEMKKIRIFGSGDRKVVKFELSVKSLILVALGVLLFFFASEIIGVLVILFFSFILTSAVMPVYQSLLDKGVSKFISILIVYLAFIILVLLLVGLVIVPFGNQIAQFFSNLPELTVQITDFVVNIKVPFVELDPTVIEQSIEDYFLSLQSDLVPTVTTGFTNIWGFVGAALSAFGGGVVAFMAVVTVSIYTVVDHDYLVDNYVLRFVDAQERLIVRKLIYDVEVRLGKWLVGEAILMVIIGIMSWLLLVVLGVPFAFPLAVIAGLLEMVPNIGPTVAALIAVPLATIDGGLGVGLLTLGGYGVIQQLENNFIVPKIMSNAAGLRPIIVIVGMLFGFSLAGVLGGLLTVPLLGIAKIGFDFYIELQKLRAVN